MPGSTPRLLQSLAQNFKENRLDAVAQHFVFPMPFYANDTLQVFGAAHSLTEALTLYRDATVRAGIVEIVPRLLAEGLPVNGYSNIWVEWDHINKYGQCVCTSQVHYVLFEDGASSLPVVELIDYKALAFPEVADNFVIARIA
ncbi:MAG: hypothetical protein AAF727_03820 [Pseudomonadota bacterium]